MDLTKLFSMIEKEKEKLKDIANTKNREVEFFDDVVSNNTFSNLQGLLSLDCLKITIAYLCASSNGVDYEKIYDLVMKNKFLIDLNNEGLNDILLKFLTISKHSSQGFFLKKKIEKLIKKLKIEEFDLDSIKELLELNGENFFKVIALINCINDLKADYISRSDDFDEFRSSELRGIRVSTKRKNELVKDFLEQMYNVDKIYKDLSIISTYYNKIRNEDNNKKRKARKSITNYVNLTKTLNSLTTKKLLDKTIINNLINLIDNEEILKELLYQIGNEQKKYFEELNTEYLKLSQDNKINIQAILKKYEIDFNKLPSNLKNKVLKLENKELENFLTSIKELGITNFEMIYFVLEYSNSKVINNVINLIKDGIITLDFILNNKELLAINNEFPNNYNSLLEKIQLFKEEGINYRLFINDLSVYLIDYKKFLYNIKILKQYNLLNGLNKLNSFELLKEDNLENKIDLFLELGYEKILEENIVLLNTEISKIKKLYILKNIGLLPTNITSLMEVIENKSFLNYISDVDSYLFNIVNYRINSSLIENKEFDFSKYFLFNNNSRVIEINGVILSKNRINRNILKLEKVNLSNHDKLIYSLVYGSILTEEEYNTIISNLNDIDKKIASRN